jgi:competence protein ComEA
MLQRPVYQTALILVTLAALAGGLWLLVAPADAPGLEVVPPAATASAVGSTDETVADQPAAADRIDINKATPEELAAALPGIGKVLSERIVAYREANGPFERTDQLMAVSGIGPVTYADLRPLLTVGE